MEGIILFRDQGSHRKGFTLVEMAMVLTIVGLLVAIIAPRFMRHSDEAKIAKTKAGLEKLRLAFELYKGQTGYYPSLDNEGVDLKNSTPPCIDTMPGDGFTGDSGIYYSMGAPPCHSPPGGWCREQSPQERLFPNLPDNDPEYGDQDFSSY